MKRTERILSWIFATIFFVIGLLNLFWIHPVPGFFYIILSFFYLPIAHTFLKKRFRFSIPLVVKIIAGLAILWWTLAMGELADMFGL